MRTVRLDGAQERVLASVRQRTGLTISEILKRGLKVYAESALKERPETPYEQYARLDLGPGGCALAPAKDAKTAITELIRKKLNR